MESEYLSNKSLYSIGMLLPAAFSSLLIYGNYGALFRAKIEALGRGQAKGLQTDAHADDVTQGSKSSAHHCVWLWS